jgi:hypothetical protein
MARGQFFLKEVYARTELSPMLSRHEISSRQEVCFKKLASVFNAFFAPTMYIQVKFAPSPHLKNWPQAFK